jgi:hypothetical protein
MRLADKYRALNDLPDEAHFELQMIGQAWICERSYV